MAHRDWLPIDMRVILTRGPANFTTLQPVELKFKENDIINLKSRYGWFNIVNSHAYSNVPTRGGQMGQALKF